MDENLTPSPEEQQNSEENQEQETNQSDSSLSLSEASLDFLHETAKWGNLLAIIGFIGIGLIVIMAFFAGAAFSAIPSGIGGAETAFGAFATFIYLIVAVLYFIPTRFLFIFSKKLREALASNDDQLLEDALSKQKSLYKYMGILTIIVLSIYALIFIGFGLMGAIIGSNL